MKTTLTVILAILALLFLQRECSRPPAVDPVPDTIRITNVIYDSVVVSKAVPVPYPKYIYDTIPVPADVDTAAILRDYYNVRVYNRTLVDDKDLWVELIDTVHQNKLLAGVYNYKIRKPLTIHETYIIHPPPAPRFQLYAGGFVTGSQDYFGAGPAVFAKTKRDHLYGAGYDAINKTAQVHMQWKISLGK